MEPIGGIVTTRLVRMEVGGQICIRCANLREEIFVTGSIRRMLVRLENIMILIIQITGSSTFSYRCNQDLDSSFLSNKDVVSR